MRISTLYDAICRLYPRRSGLALRSNAMVNTGNARLVQLEGTIHRWLMRSSIPALRISMGLVFLGFGILKFFPGLSPAEGLVEATIDKMTSGWCPAPSA